MSMSISCCDIVFGPWLISSKSFETQPEKWSYTYTMTVPPKSLSRPPSCLYQMCAKSSVRFDALCIRNEALILCVRKSTSFASVPTGVLLCAVYSRLVIPRCVSSPHCSCASSLSCPCVFAQFFFVFCFLRDGLLLSECFIVSFPCSDGSGHQMENIRENRGKDGGS